MVSNFARLERLLASSEDARLGHCFNPLPRLSLTSTACVLGQPTIDNFILAACDDWIHKAKAGVQNCKCRHYKL